jgi:hypothetical protein
MIRKEKAAKGIYRTSLLCGSDQSFDVRVDAATRISPSSRDVTGSRTALPPCPARPACRYPVPTLRSHTA